MTPEPSPPSPAGRRHAAERLPVEGWLVAEAELERSWSGSPPPERCWLFRSVAGWALLSVGITVHCDDSGLPTGGAGAVRAQRFSSLVEVVAHVARTHAGDAWVQLLDAGQGNDPDLYCAWVPERIRRDLDAASLHRPDLALFTGLLGGSPAPAPGRQLPGWRDDALAQMAAHLAELGFEVEVEGQVPSVAYGAEVSEDQIGSLRLRRYGLESLGIVRVDLVGEVYVRVPEPERLPQPSPSSGAAGSC